jgi:hypothetical protein
MREHPGLHRVILPRRAEVVEKGGPGKFFAVMVARDRETIFGAHGFHIQGLRIHGGDDGDNRDQAAP